MLRLRTRRSADFIVTDRAGENGGMTNIPFANSCRSTEYLRRRSPRLVFHVVGLSRDDMPTVVQAGGNHPGSQRNRPWSLIHAAAAVTQITKVTLWVLD
jgi:hypothetical protein